jgi:hypothetical protein
LCYVAIQGREREEEGEGEGGGEGEQAIGKLTDLFTDRYRQTNPSRAANLLFELFTGPRIISSSGSRLLVRRRGDGLDTGQLRSMIIYGSRPKRRSRSSRTGSSGVRMGRQREGFGR